MSLSIYFATDIINLLEIIYIYYLLLKMFIPHYFANYLQSKIYNFFLAYKVMELLAFNIFQ